jgi:hypothetical protein
MSMNRMLPPLHRGAIRGRKRKRTPRPLTPDEALLLRMAARLREDIVIERGKVGENDSRRAS